ncbi:MAG: hypothetical protein Q4C86_10655 [bacterium]|nr:hypothetical protein [bacterium]
MSNMLIYLLAWLIVNTALYVFAMWKDVDFLVYVMIFASTMTSAPWKEWPQF